MRNGFGIYLDDAAKKFLSSLRELRHKSGLTHAEIFNKTGIHERNLRGYEMGKKYPRIETLLKLADFYGYDLSESFIAKKLKKYII